MASDTKWNDVDVDKVNALLQWIHSLSFEGSVNVEIETLRCGAPFGHILKMVDDSFFGIDWIAEVTKYNEDANWRLKENNLRKVYKRLGEYIHEYIGDCDFDQWNIDFEQSAREDLHGILRLLQLTVVVAFKGQNNVVFVANVDRLSPQVQMAIKHALDEFELCTREETQSPKPLSIRREEPRLSINHSLLYEAEDTMKTLSEEVEALKSKVDEKDGIIKKMERKLSELQERKAEEIKEIRQKLSEREIAYTELEYDKSMLSEESKRLKEEIGDLRARLSETSRVEEDRFRGEKSRLSDRGSEGSMAASGGHDNQAYSSSSSPFDEEICRLVLSPLPVPSTWCAASSMDSSPLSESDDSMSEATQLFNIKMEKDFMKAFPLRSDQRTSMGPPTSAIRGNSNFGKTPLVRGTAPLPTPHTTKNMTASTPIRFSLDESFVTGATAQNLSSKVAELTTELDLHKRKLERQSKELASTVDRMERYKVEADELIRDNTELKKAKQRLEEELRGAQLMGNTENSLNDSTLVSKLCTWLEWKDAQMNTMAALMASARLWTEENRTLVASSYRSIEPLVISQDRIIALTSGSVQDFHGIHESPIAEAVEEEETNPNDTTLRGNNESVYMDESAREEMQDTSMNRSGRILPLEDELESILDNTMHEKDEKIDRLEFELNKALEQVELYKGRTTRLAVLEEKKESLEHRLKFLEELHDQSIRDLHASNRLCEDQLQLGSPDGKRMERDEARSLVNTMRNMQRKIDEWEEAYRQREKETREAFEAVAAAKEEAAMERERAEEVKKEAATLESEKTSLMAQLEEAKQQLGGMSRMEMTPLVNDTIITENAPTDAGDTTQIVHFHFNPLDEARKELREEEERKRQSDGGVGPSAKRRRSEDDSEIEELKKKLQAAESRCERLSNHNIDSVRNFRHILLKVTGYDIKMKQEESVQLTSVYDTLNQHFGFMVHDGRVEMIELLDKPYDGPDRFKEEAEMWMGQHNSVPAFLAACQLKLFREVLVEGEETLMYGKEEDEMDASAGPSFSVLQED